ncbi:MAG: HEAT repeat domain-containing protein [Desulfobulbaceae bacterium]|nr:HEAT repeat domain-containing protein [Desulfobulbaceae bacterium]
MGNRVLKKHIFKLLLSPDLESVFNGIGHYPATDVANILFSAICHNDELLRWRGISSMGVTLARLAVEDMEKSRIFMRRLLWSLNDESGGIGWGAPESMAEAMVYHNGLAEEYIHMLISYMRGDGEELLQHGNYLEHELLQRGLLWGICRMAGLKARMLIERGVREDIMPYLRSSDNEVRGLAARACGLLQISEAIEELEKLAVDESPLRFYEDGMVSSHSVGEFASKALAMLDEGPERI